MRGIDSVMQLRIILMAGLIILILTGCILTFFYLMERSVSSSARQQDNFNRILREYDAAFMGLRFTEEEFDRLNETLNRLEGMAITVESWLSVLKRRRALANIHIPSMIYYRISLDNALAAYPSSQPIIAIAVSSIIKNAALNREAEEQLREWLPLINDNNFNALRLAVHVILGDFRNPQRALLLPENIFSAAGSLSAASDSPYDGANIINLNLVILRALRNDHHGAAAEIQAMLNSPYLSENILRFAAEFHYDFGNLLRSAEIFSFINDERAMIRQADALYLAGYTDMAATIWNILSGYLNETSLYNLAVTSDDSRQAAIFLEKLANINTDQTGNNYPSLARQFGIVRFSRFLDYSHAVFLLNNSINLSPLNFPYIDLEICRRLAQEHNIERKMAETWLLLDRHDKNEDLYKWAAWHFFFQRNFTEIEILINRMEQLSLSARLIDIYRVLFLMHTGNLDAAETILRSIPDEDADWTVYANLGRILEAVHSPARAIEQYNMAAAKLQLSMPLNNRTAARLYMNIARCYSAISRPIEAIRYLQYALNLDPFNLTAQFELERLLF
jgi:hypothetical protein